MIDISSVKHESFGKSKFWLLVVDDCTDMCWSFFLQKKSELGQVMINHIRDLKEQHGVIVKKI